MLNQTSISNLRHVKIQPVNLIAIGISTVFILSIFHHTMNFWGLAWWKQLLIVALIPVLTIPVNYVLALMWDTVIKTSWIRWLLLFLPLLLIVSYTTWRVYQSPLISHSIEITAKQNSGRTEVRLLEIRESSGAVVRFPKITELGDWVVQDQTLTAVGPRPIRYSFVGPYLKPIRLRFLTSPAAGDVEVKVDGWVEQASLFENRNGQRVIDIDPKYRFGIPGMAMIVLVIVIDFLALLFLFTIFWLVQEVHQTAQPALEHSDHFSRREYWRWLGILLVIAFVLHAVDFFAVPLQLGEDSAGYLDGAVHWAKYHNLEGASPIRGPGTSFMFLPAILLFERNPWAIKLLLHLLAYASVALTYHLGWQLTKKYWFAFLAGLLTVFTPDRFQFADFVMSEIPNMFIVLIFCILLITALETLSFRSMIAAMLVGSFATLIRTENVILLLLAVLFLLIKVVQNWMAQRNTDPEKKFFPWIAPYAKQIGFATLVSILPILAWSAHNYQQHGFFGLSNYAPEVMYTGWVYEGEASHIPITDQSSPAVQIINKFYWSDPVITQEEHVPTGWKIYYQLIDRGFTSEEIFALLRQATIDSITNDYRITWQVIVVKIRDSFKPEPAAMFTFPLPGEETRPNSIKSTYFDEEEFAIPSFVLLQRKVNEFLVRYYGTVYPKWAWFCVGAMLLCLYRKPAIPWLPLVLITLFRVGLPNAFGLSLWRFVVPGLPLMQILALAALQSLYLFALLMFRSYRNNKLTAANPQRIS